MPEDGVNLSQGNCVMNTSQEAPVLLINPPFCRGLKNIHLANAAPVRCHRGEIIELTFQDERQMIDFFVTNIEYFYQNHVKTKVIGQSMLLFQPPASL